jgi:glutaminyl-peptide cyclotransferase
VFSLISRWKLAQSFAAAVAAVFLIASRPYLPEFARTEATPEATPEVTSGPPDVLIPQVLAVMPHDPNAFTEGLVYDNGLLYESTGGYRTRYSTLREVDPTTGQVLRENDLDPAYYGEGLALVGDQLFQLTWKDGIVFRYDRATFNLLGANTYHGEGWGLCYDGQYLYRSDGSTNLTVHDPNTFDVVKIIPVTLDNQPIININELECVGDSIYANVWFTNYILRIDKATGIVTAVADASGLITPEEIGTNDRNATLNGIAYVPERDTFLITGKWWPKMFEVRFVPAGTSQ